MRIQRIDDSSALRFTGLHLGQGIVVSVLGVFVFGIKPVIDDIDRPGLKPQIRFFEHGDYLVKGLPDLGVRYALGRCEFLDAEIDLIHRRLDMLCTGSKYPRHENES